MIEEARQSNRNPPIPSWLNASYQAAWQQLVELALRDLQNATDPLLVLFTIAAIAIGKGQLTRGRIAAIPSVSPRCWPPLPAGALDRCCR
jgi:hypothetical protein